MRTRAGHYGRALTTLPALQRSSMIHISTSPAPMLTRMSDSPSSDLHEPDSADGPGILAGLPRTRPQRASARRLATRVAKPSAEPGAAPSRPSTAPPRRASRRAPATGRGTRGTGERSAPATSRVAGKQRAPAKRGPAAANGHPDRGSRPSPTRSPGRSSRPAAPSWSHRSPSWRESWRRPASLQAGACSGTSYRVCRRGEPVYSRHAELPRPRSRKAGDPTRIAVDPLGRIGPVRAVAPSS